MLFVNGWYQKKQIGIDISEVLSGYADDSFLDDNMEELIAEAYSAKWKKYAADELIQLLGGL